MASTIHLALEACRATIKWAETPGEHGGNPYCKPHVKAAERALAAYERRPVEAWAAPQEE